MGDGRRTMMPAGTSQLTMPGSSRLKNAMKLSFSFCHTINEVTSPNGEMTPPALQATTMLIQLTTT